MAGSGPVSKKSSRHGHRTKKEKAQVVTVIEPGSVIVPPPPVDEILPSTLVVWESLFNSSVARALDLDADVGVLRRWLTTVDQYERAMNDLRTGTEPPITLGSKGQPVVSPLVKYIATLEAQIGRYERELGLTHMSRARLGLKLAEGQLTAEQINALVGPIAGAKDPKQLPAGESESAWEEVGT